MSGFVRLEAGSVLLLLAVPFFSDGCCPRTRGAHSGREPPGSTRGLERALRGAGERQHYRAVEGEIFIMPCPDKDQVWSTTRGGEEMLLRCGEVIHLEVKHSGNYTYGKSGAVLHLQVLRRGGSPCTLPGKGSVLLKARAGGLVPCPGLTCDNNTHITWFKGNSTVSLCERAGLLQLCTVNEDDTGLYFCDRETMERGVRWTLRRAVHITVIPRVVADRPARIARPDSNRPETVELGRPHNLTCKAYFPYEVDFSPELRWYVNYGGNPENRTPLHSEAQQQKLVLFTEVEVTQAAIIEEVTPLHLNHTYTCVASNSVGNSSATVSLARRRKVKWPSLVGYPVASLLAAGGLGLVVYVRRLELLLIFRSHFQGERLHKEGKDFDVFLSYVWSPSPAGVTGDRPGLRPSSLGPTAGGFPSSTLMSEDGAAEVLLPRVLEDLWGYRVCLLERDLLPGGVYTKDVVGAIRSSRMLICLLSSGYLSNPGAVFVLESGIQALLQTSAFKVLLIRTSPSLADPDLPLPSVVQRALKVLPVLDWTSRRPGGATRDFWRSLRKALPTRTVRDTPPSAETVIM